MAQHRERIVGFVVLALVAVIGLPMLFDGEGARESELLVSIPAAPRFPVMEASRPAAPVLADTRAVAEPMPERVEARQPRMQLAAEAVAASQAVEAKPAAPKASAPETPAPAAAAAPRGLTLEHEVPVLDQQGVPVAWTLQLAAFKERPNAEGLRDRLIKAGYKAYIREKNNFSRVYVGPEVQRSELEQIKAQLARELKLDGLILRFTTG